ncbi:hypothetical protein [Arthrobacter pityocampae]|uniref:hypothetical protein n=1 Tax=Arthrobacter pityocampae TaxID=547334 RepID=UPI0011B01A51|nr:hypothetical protein [Arthrobacter pityocampae]
MRAQLVAAAAAGLLLLTGCAVDSAVGAPGAEQPLVSPPVKAPDARPDAQVPEADVPIADVAPEAEGVNEPAPEQAQGIRMTSDADKGLDGDDVSDAALAGGCVPGYGTDGACLPPVPPRLAAEHAGHTGMDGPEMAAFYLCEDVRALIPDGLAVQDEDYLGLDSNKDGVACGKGDDAR